MTGEPLYSTIWSRPAFASGPIAESHVEMDGAWALYEAWVKIQCGEIDSALIFCFGRSSVGETRETLSLQNDPYTLAPLGVDAISMAALQARAGLDAGKWTEADMAAVAVNSRANGKSNPEAHVKVRCPPLGPDPRACVVR